MVFERGEPLKAFLFNSRCFEVEQMGILRAEIENLATVLQVAFDGFGRKWFNTRYAKRKLTFD